MKQLKFPGMQEEPYEMRVYLASGWFTPKQEEARLMIKGLLEDLEIDHYSPKDDNLYDPESNDPFIDVYKEDIIQIKKADIVVASLIGLDPGTVFECGVAVERTPVVMYCDFTTKTNLMLAGGAYSYVTSENQLRGHLSDWKEYLKEEKFPPQIHYGGKIE